MDNGVSCTSVITSSAADLQELSSLRGVTLSIIGGGVLHRLLEAGLPTLLRSFKTIHRSSESGDEYNRLSMAESIVRFRVGKTAWFGCKTGGVRRGSNWGSFPVVSIA